jgi:serine/threonine protein kinase
LHGFFDFREEKIALARTGQMACDHCARRPDDQNEPEAIMRGVPNCPDAQSLQRFLLGRNTPDEATALEEHLDSCESCQATLNTLHADDSMVKALQAQNNTEDVTANDGVRLLTEWLKKLRPKSEVIPPLDDTKTFEKSDNVASTVSFEFLAPRQNPTELGRLGQYHVRKVLGAGGMGVVFEAYDPDLDRLVALKTMLPGQAAIPSARMRFLREAKAAAAIKHDHIVTIYQVGEDREIAFLAMEYLEGESLDQRLRRERRLPLTELLLISRECAEALAAAHAKGLIHRDIKPGNIWLERSRGQTSADASRVKLLDFGLALPAADDAHLTQTGAVVGTPAFMAPEQLRGQVVDARADLFSLGCVMYRMATGEAAFKGTHTVSTLIAVATTNPRPPQELNPELPPALCDLILLLLAKDPNDRPSSALAVVEAIQAIEKSANQPPVARVEKGKAVTQQKETPAAPKRRFTGHIWLTAVALFVCVLGWTGYQMLPPNKNAETPRGPEPEEDSANTVTGDGVGPNRVYADPTRSLQDVVDFRDLIGASADELRAWQAQMEPGFRLAHVTSRRGTGPTLFNAVAVREKTERLVRYVPDLSSDAAKADLARNFDMDGLSALDQCTYFNGRGENGWVQARLWIKDAVKSGSWGEPTVPDIKRKIKDLKSEGLRIRCIEWLPEVKSLMPYQTIVAEDQGRKAEVIYALSPDELVHAVERQRRKGSRPDLLTPYWEDHQLQFALVTVENDDGPDWQFRMEMTAKSYRSESDRQRKRGWFPLSVVSYGNEAEMRYAAIWIRGRMPNTSAPPADPVSARTLADRASRAVSWASAKPKEVYVDGARAMGEFRDFQEVVGATADQLKAWHEKLDPKFRIAYVSSRNGTGENLFNAVAVQDKEPLHWRIHIQMTQAMADQAWKQNHEDGYRLLCGCGNLDPGEKLPWNGTQIWVKDNNGGTSWHGPLRSVVSWNRDKNETPENVRPISLDARMSPDGLGGSTIHGQSLGRAWEAFYASSSDELLATLEFYQRKGWRPDVVHSYLEDGHLRHQFVVVDNSDKVDWRFRIDMSRADYEKESAQQKRQGLFPLTLNSYGNEGVIHYAAIFVRYRQPTKN